MAIYLVDMIGGNDANPGTYDPVLNNNARAVKSIPAHVPGDTVRFKHGGAPVQVGGGAMATWNDLTNTVPVTWSSAQVMDLDASGTAWTAGVAGSAPAMDASQRKRVGGAARVTKAAATAGIIAYKATGLKNLSGYQCVSFWIRSGATPFLAGQLSLRLCSDVAGAVPVHTIPIPSMITARYAVVTAYVAPAMAANIQSLSLYSEGAVLGLTNIWLDCILACKDGGLSLNSLISKNTAGESWYCVQSIADITAAGCTIHIDGSTETLATTARAYAAQTAGLNQTLPLMVRRPVMLWNDAGISLNGITFLTPVAASAGLPATYSFGWSDFNAGSPDSETWVDGQGSSSVCVNNPRSNIKISRLGIVRFLTGLTQGTGVSNEIDIACNHCASGGITVNQASGNSFDVRAANQNGLGATGSGIASASLQGNKWRIGQANGNGLYGMALGNRERVSPLFGAELFLTNNQSAASIFNGAESVLDSATYGPSGISAGLAATNPNYAPNSKARSGPPVMGASNILLNIQITARDVERVAGDSRIFSDNHVWYSVADVVHGAGGAAMRSTLVGPNRTSMYPADLRLGRIACKAGVPVRFKAWTRRDTLNATSQLMAMAGDAGLLVDVVVSAAGPANTWEQLVLSFTPTANGFVDIFWRTYSDSSGTKNVWLDEATAEGQAAARLLNGFDFLLRGAPMISNTAGGVIVIED